jgi:hypothetical protein
MHATDALGPGHPVTLELDETLDAAAALRARELLERAPPQARLVLDFVHVRNVDWFPLATLVVALARQPPGRVAVRGLCEHHLRLLRQLGVDVDRLLGRAHRPGEDAETGSPFVPSAAFAAPRAPGASAQA